MLPHDGRRRIWLGCDFARRSRSPKATRGRLRAKRGGGPPEPHRTRLNLPFMIEDHERRFSAATSTGGLGLPSAGEKTSRGMTSSSLGSPFSSLRMRNSSRGRRSSLRRHEPLLPPDENLLPREENLLPPDEKLVPRDFFLLPPASQVRDSWSPVRGEGSVFIRDYGTVQTPFRSPFRRSPNSTL